MELDKMLEELAAKVIIKICGVTPDQTLRLLMPLTVLISA
jgi:hypothetical protein